MRFFIKRSTFVNSKKTDGFVGSILAFYKLF